MSKLMAIVLLAVCLKNNYGQHTWILCIAKRTTCGMPPLAPTPSIIVVGSCYVLRYACVKIDL